VSSMDRKTFLAGAAGLGGAVLLGGCGSSSSASSGSSSAKRPGINKEPGNLAILEWDGYQAFGTPTNKKPGGLEAGADYTKKFGASGITYSLIVNDSEALNKVRSGQQFDILHPCIENLQDYVNDDLVQPWDTSLLSSFSNLNPALVKGGQLNGKQYLIPWDWGYGSVIYRTDKVDPADAKGWELFWNPKYKDRISMWNGNTTNFEIAALKLGYGGAAMDHLSDDQLTNAKNALIEQYPLNKFLWSSEYTDLQPALQNGDIWIAYSWQDQWVYAKAKGIPMAYMEPSQGRLGWYCGFMLGKDTKNYYHAHDYVESYINHKACLSLTNYFYYGSADDTIKPSEIADQAVAKSLDIGNPNVLSSANVHLQSWEPNEAAVQQAWEEVTASGG
jgi:spermidine/putrescine transport system substrate-binding protein